MEQQTKEDYIEIDLMRLLKAVWRHMVVIVLAMLLCGGAGFSVAYWLVPAKYQATALMYVNNSSISMGSTSISLSDLSASQTLVDTYIAILKTRLTLDDVIKEAQLNYTFEQLEGMITAGSVNGTEIFRVTVTSTDPQEAERIANTITVVLPDKISQILDGSSARTVDLAVTPRVKSSPSYQKYALVGALAGLLLSAGIVVIRELLDEQIHSEGQLLQGYGLPVLASVPDLLASKSGKGYGSYYAAAAEGKDKS